MAFGKRGRPAADRLLRQRETYLAVAPLLLRSGERRFSMRAAARAAGLSIGALCCYFPNKRELVLHGLSAAASDRLCRQYRASMDDPLGDPVERYFDLMAGMLAFVRPSGLAALRGHVGALIAGHRVWRKVAPRAIGT